MDGISILEKIYKEPFIRDYRIASLTTWKIGGVSAVVAFPETINGLITLINFAIKNIIPYYIIGRGSNVLVGDDYFNGIIIYLRKNFSSIFMNGNEIEFYAGVTLNRIGILAKKLAFKNVEFLSGIPGSLGGALITNAEAHKVSISDFVKSVKVFENGIFRDYSQSMCDFSYRHSIFEEKDNFCIVKANLVFEKGDVKIINQNYKNIIEFRKMKQPKYPSGGSIFKNPKNGPTAGYLIDKLKLKGLHKGGAVISKAHGNFILNKNKAKAIDVLYLIEKIKNQVTKAYNIELQLEIKKINC